MPRKNRLHPTEEAYYHVVSRVVDKIFRFTPEENERNVDLLRCVETFSGVQVISYCFMSNHLHILVRVPKREIVSETVILDRVEALYGSGFRNLLQGRWKSCKEREYFDLLEKEHNQYLKRMYDVGEFMKTLKQRLTMSFNARHSRKGTLWEERYKSILLEPTEHVLSAVAAYIDLNPVRGGMVSDPMKYRFSSYGEACRGDEKARAGLCHIYQKGGNLPSWEEVAPTYRLRIVLKAIPTEKRAGMSPEAIQQAIENKGKLPLSEVVSDRCAYFTSGVALGSTDFLRWATKLRRKQAKAPIFPPGIPASAEPPPPDAST